MTWSSSEHLERIKRRSIPNYSATFSGDNPRGSDAASLNTEKRKNVTAKTHANYLQNNELRSTYSPESSDHVLLYRKGTNLLDYIEEITTIYLSGVIANSQVRDAKIDIVTLDSLTLLPVEVVTSGKSNEYGHFNIEFGEKFTELYPKNTIYGLLVYNSDGNARNVISDTPFNDVLFYVLDYDLYKIDKVVNVNLITSFISINTIHKFYENDNLSLIESFSEFKDEKFIDRVTLMSILEEVFRNTLKRKFGDEQIKIINSSLVSALISFH